jgi:aminoglycoside phosphotransferase family enzyme
MMLYNKAIEYYSALGDERHHDYLLKLQRLFQDKRIQEVTKEGSTTAQPSEGEPEEEESKAIN